MCFIASIVRHPTPKLPLRSAAITPCSSLTFASRLRRCTPARCSPGRTQRACPPRSPARARARPCPPAGRQRGWQEEVRAVIICTRYDCSLGDAKQQDICRHLLLSMLHSLLECVSLAELGYAGNIITCSWGVHCMHTCVKHVCAMSSELSVCSYKREGLLFVVTFIPSSE